MVDGAPHRHRRRQPRDARRRDACVEPVPAPPGPPGEPDHVLAAPPGAVVHVLRALRRPDEPGAARRRGARRDRLRARDGAVAHAVRRGGPAVARRPAAQEPPDRSDRQHAPQRDLHRQAVLAGRADGAARHRRAARVRDAAARAHGGRAGAAGARSRGALRGRPLPPPARALGHRAARPIHAAALPRGGPRGRHPRPERARHRVRAGLARRVPGVPLPRLRRAAHRRRRDRAARRHRAVARARRGGDGVGHGALRRQLGRAHPGARDGADRRAARP